MTKEKILILDFGSQYTHLIKSTLARLGIDSVIEPADLPCLPSKEHEIRGIVLSGGAYSVNQDKIPFDKKWLSIGVPILGICYGHQLLARIFGGEVEKTKGEYGKEIIKCNTLSPIFSGIKTKSVVWMSHSDSVIKLPTRFSSIASTVDYKNAAICYEHKNIYGLQFHPEVSHTVEGVNILDNFATRICKLKRGAKWSPRQFIEETMERYKPIIANKTVIMGLSGGVDSSTLAATLRSFLPKEQLLAVYINSGLEPLKTKDDISRFCKDFDIRFRIKDSSESFFKALKGVTEPNKKRIVIGRVFIKEFEKVAQETNAKIFAQGTIWSDVVESGVAKYSTTIKPHHNVGGLPKKLKFQLIEPFRELFKDQVRELALFLGLPKSLANKQVFPGPGFAIRIEGEVDKEKVAIVRKSTEIIEEIILKHKLARNNLMAFAVYINVKSSGIKGDMKITNNFAIVIRVVETVNLLTANFSEKIYPYLGEISSRIIKETGAGKVLYDITNKPPSTIDWQ